MKTVTAGELEKDKLINAVTKINNFLSKSGIEAIYCVAAMKHLVALEEERSGMIVERIDWSTQTEQ
jgi:hypothetical protein